MVKLVNDNGKRALLIGVGGIGGNVYLTELMKLGYDVTTVDNSNPADHTTIDTVNGVFDVAVICVPNFLHTYFADSIAPYTKVVFIEKPGLPSADQWNALCDKHPHTKFIMCKNNMYRDTYGFLDNVGTIDDITSIKVNWLNKNRVPNAGYWSTNRKQSWGGVALDLFPHLYCQLLTHFGKIENFTRVNHLMMQKWNLEDLTGSDYGAVNVDGVYDVCDYATEKWLLNDKVIVEVSASWKEGIDDQSIVVQTTDSSYKWDFGLCPAEAYGEMIEKGQIEDYDTHKTIDTWIHKHLEVYHEG
jgi:predicted dehydrogenase|tara:strand:- start:413 stop:1315 length:903 start_codon:yes stop_codon:yes gene_type:complete